MEAIAGSEQERSTVLIHLDELPQAVRAVMPALALKYTIANGLQPNRWRIVEEVGYRPFVACVGIEVTILGPELVGNVAPIVDSGHSIYVDSNADGGRQFSAGLGYLSSPHLPQNALADCAVSYTHLTLPTIYSV